MKRAEWLKETRKMRFEEEAYGGWQGGSLPQEETARLAFQLLFWLHFACALLICVLFVSHRGFYESTRIM